MATDGATGLSGAVPRSTGLHSALYMMCSPPRPRTAGGVRRRPAGAEAVKPSAVHSFTAGLVSTALKTVPIAVGLRRGEDVLGERAPDAEPGAVRGRP